MMAWPASMAMTLPFDDAALVGVRVHFEAFALPGGPSNSSMVALAPTFGSVFLFGAMLAAAVVSAGLGMIVGLAVRKTKRAGFPTLLDPLCFRRSSPC